MKNGDELLAFVASSCDADAAVRSKKIQSLWSGYGEIVQINLRGSNKELPNSVVLKRVNAALSQNHSDCGHFRKVYSYKVEAYFYENYSRKCTSDICRVPLFISSKEKNQELWILLEDLGGLDQMGYPLKLVHPKKQQIDLILHWLANFHAIFLGQEPIGLWPIGTYWHLQTRPDEWRDMKEEGGNVHFMLFISYDLRFETECVNNRPVLEFHDISDSCAW